MIERPIAIAAAGEADSVRVVAAAAFEKQHLVGSNFLAQRSGWAILSGQAVAKMASHLSRHFAGGASAAATTHQEKIAEGTGMVIHMDARPLRRRQIVFDCIFLDLANAAMPVKQSTQGWSFGS
jgi:hypothetical protein